MVGERQRHGVTDDEYEQLELLSGLAAKQARELENTEIGKRLADPNPCVKAFGFGPPQTLCKECQHLFYHQRSNRYYKCHQRNFSFGPATDHRVRWNACARFKRIIEELRPEVLN